jgi:hypothetical protein
LWSKIGKKLGVLGVRAVWYDRDYAALAASRTDGRGVITLLGDCRTRRDIWPDVEWDLSLALAICAA